MDFRILGPLEVITSGAPLELRGRKQRLLLATLLVNANRAVSAERLIEALWEDTPPRSARTALQGHVFALRKLLGRERIETTLDGYTLRVSDGELDWDRFEALRLDGMHAEALALWRGAPLGELAESAFLRSEAARLEEARLSCLETRLGTLLDSGEHALVVPELERLVHTYPFRERLVELLGLALYRSGRQVDALALLRAAQHRLIDELGLEPRRTLRELQRAILRQDASLERVADDGQPDDERDGIFVGRSRELAALSAAIEDARAGRGRTIVLTGEPGIGKSRLLEEAIRRGHSRGFAVLVGRCWEEGGAPPFWPWTEILRSYHGAAAELAHLLPELDGFGERRRIDDPELARFRLFESLADLLRRASSRQPLVVAVDDLHAADVSTLLLLEFIGRCVASWPVLLIIAVRDVDPVPSPALTAALAALSREPRTLRLELAGLSRGEVRAYLEQAAAELASADMLRALYERTDGNPLFLVETVRLLQFASGHPDADALTTSAVPPTIRDVLTRRLGRMSDSCNHALACAAVLGRECELTVLEETAGLGREQLLDALEEAFDDRVVAGVAERPGRMRFTHSLLRDAVYEQLPPRRRMLLHGRAVDALERVKGTGNGEHLAELARHALSANDIDAGCNFARRAGDWALEQLAYEEAARLYQTADAALPGGSERARCEILLAAGEAWSRAGDAAAASRAYLDAAAIARRERLGRELAVAAVGYGGRLIWARAGNDDRLVPLLEEALEGVPRDEIPLRVRLLARLAGARRDDHDRTRRDELSRTALALARRSDDPRALAFALEGRAAAVIAPDTVAECLGLGAELCNLGRRIGDGERIFMGHLHTQIANFMMGDIASAEQDLAAAAVIAADLRQPIWLWHVASLRALLALTTGEFGRAARLIAEAAAIGVRTLPSVALTADRLQRLELAEHRGEDLVELEPEIRDLAARYPRRPVFRCSLAHLHARIGRHEEAADVLLDLTASGCAAIPFDQEWLVAVSYLAETASDIRDGDHAADLYETLEPWEDLNVADSPEAVRGPVSRYLGLLAAASERLDDAVCHFERALELSTRARMRPWLARAQSECAATLLTRRGRGDRERAGLLIDRAEATYRTLGMHAS